MKRFEQALRLVGCIAAFCIYAFFNNGGWEMIAGICLAVIGSWLWRTTRP